MRNQRNFVVDDWNKPLLEVTDKENFEVELAKDTLPEYRSVLHSPVFTDTRYIYTISTYIKPLNEEKQDF